MAAVPSLRNLSPEELDGVLDQIAQDYPPPSPVQATLLLDDSVTTPVALGTSVPVVVHVEWTPTDQYNRPTTAHLLPIDGPVAPKVVIAKCPGIELSSGPEVINCVGFYTVQSFNSQVYAEVNFHSVHGQFFTTVRSSTLTIPTQ
jgi:hypothetical protein